MLFDFFVIFSEVDNVSQPYRIRTNIKLDSTVDEDVVNLTIVYSSLLRTNNLTSLGTHTENICSPIFLHFLSTFCVIFVLYYSEKGRNLASSSHESTVLLYFRRKNVGSED